MTNSDLSDDRVLFDAEPDKRIATITLNNPTQRNSYDAAMRDSVARCLDRVADDDDLTVVLLRGADGVFSTGADMNNAYGWYGEQELRTEQEPSQSTPPAHGGSKVIRLLPQPDGLPEGHGWRDQRLCARRRLRDGADDRHLGDRGQHEDRHAGHAFPRTRAWQPAHVLPPPRPGSGPPTASHRRRHRRRGDRAPGHLHRDMRRRPASRRGPGTGRRRRPRCPPTAW